jgi:hypothetical protein
MRRLMRDPRPRLAALAIGSIVFLASLGVGMQLGRVASVDARAQSDHFWSLTDVRGMSAEEFSSLREMALSADLVVIGKFSDVKKGREWVANPAYVNDPVFKEAAMARFADAPIAIEEVIGVPRVPFAGPAVPLELFLPGPDLVEKLKATLPQERAIFFLRNKGPKDDPHRYRLTNDYQGILRDIDGRVAVMDPTAGHFLEHLDGTDFSSLVKDLHSILDH